MIYYAFFAVFSPRWLLLFHAGEWIECSGRLSDVGDVGFAAKYFH